MPKGPRGPIEKPKDRKKVLLRLWTYIYAHKWMALAAVLLTVSSNLLALLGPMLSGEAIDAIGMEPGQADFPTVFFFCGLMIVFYAVSSLLSYILSILMIQLSQRIVFQMRQQVFDRLTQLPVRYFDGTQTGDIVSRISYDIDTVNASLSNDLLQIAASVITVVGSFIMMVVISPTLVLVFVITIPMSILFTRYMTKKVRPLFHQRSVKLGEMNGFVEEIITGQKTTKAYHQEETMISRFDPRNKAAVDAYYNADYYGVHRQPVLLCAVLPPVLRPHQRGRQHPQRAAVRLRRGRAGVPPHRRGARARRCPQRRFHRPGGGGGGHGPCAVRL